MKKHCPVYLALVFVALNLSFTNASSHAATYTWTGGGNNAWNNPSNWLGNAAPPSSGLSSSDIVYNAAGASFPDLTGGYSINSLTFNNAANGYDFNLGTLTLGAGGLTQNSTSAQIFDIPVSLGAASTWTFANTGTGALSFNQGLALGSFTLTVNANGNGTLGGRITGTNTLIKGGVGTLALTGVASSLGVFSVGAGTCAINSGSLTVTAYNSVADNSVLSVGGTGSFTSGAQLLDGTAISPGTFNLNGGTSSFVFMNVGQDTAGVVNQSAGTCALTGSANASALGVSSGSSGVYNLDGGTLSSVRTVVIGNLGTGVFTQSGGSFTSPDLLLGSQSGGTGAYRLNGGTLTVSGLRVGAGTSNFVFNGGTLRTSGNNAAFLQGFTSAVVRQGGAVIDTNGFAVTIGQSLAHSTQSGDPALDGGLTKLGGGTLTLTGANTYTGGTTIRAGTLSVASDNLLGADAAPVTLAGGALVFTGSAVQTRRVFNLGVGTLAPASGGSITYLGGAINGGALAGPGSHDIRDTAVVTGARVLGGAAVTIGRDRATFTDVTFTGNSTLTVPNQALLNSTGDFTANPLTTLTFAGSANLAGAYVSGAVTVQSTGRLSGAGGSTAPLYLDGSRGVTVNPGGQLEARSSSTIELGGLLTNNGQQTGVLHVNLGGVVRGSGTFGTVNVAAAGAFNAAGTITGSLLVADGATVSLSGSGQALVVQGALTNNGVMRFASGARLSVTSGAANLVNNGVIDVISGSAGLPAGFTNNGLVLDSSVTRVKTIARAADGSSVTLQIDGYPGHSYKLQRSDSLASGSFADVQDVPAQGNAATNTAPVTLTFTDAAPLTASGFYRVQVDS